MQIAARSHDGQEWHCFVNTSRLSVDFIAQKKNGITFSEAGMIYNGSECEPLMNRRNAVNEFTAFLSKQRQKVSLVCHPKNHGYALMDALEHCEPDVKTSFLMYVSCFVDVFDLFPTAGEKAKTLESLYEQNVGRMQFSLQESQGPRSSSL